MPGIVGMVNTFNAPNYVGELFQATPEDTPLLSAIGGLTGGESVGAVLFEWQGTDLRPGAANRQRIEGATAPEAESRSRYNAYNVVEIHQETVEISYTKMGATRQRSTAGMGQVTTADPTPTDELAFQITAMLKSKALDIEKTFITGQYAYPSDLALPRRTRGILQATTTNVDTVEKGDLDEDTILDLFQKVWENGGIQESETRTVLVAAPLKRLLTKIFIKDKGYKEDTRNVGGVSLQTFETDFGRANIMLDRHMPSDVLSLLSLEELAPRFLEIPGKGHFFVEPLAKSGSSEKYQMYGEIGLKYGNEKKHGKLIVTP